MEERRYYVYILASAARVLYTGMTNSLDRRIWQHENKEFDGFTAKVQFRRLVYFESFDDVRKAIDREKQIKRWRREKKLWLIESMNRDWKDLTMTSIGRQGIAPRLPLRARSG